MFNQRICNINTISKSFVVREAKKFLHCKIFDQIAFILDAYIEVAIFQIRFWRIDHCGGLGVENGDSDMHVAVYKRSEK